MHHLDERDLEAVTAGKHFDWPRPRAREWLSNGAGGYTQNKTALFGAGSE